MLTPSAVRTPPTDACTATGPAGAAGGIRMVTWYNPAHPPAGPVPPPPAATPPTMTVGAVATAGAPLTVVPAGTVGLVAPKPVPQSTTKSPGLAATVPETAAGSATAAQSGRRDAAT